jgi:hypothetical protein
MAGLTAAGGPAPAPGAAAPSASQGKGSGQQTGAGTGSGPTRSNQISRGKGSGDFEKYEAKESSGTAQLKQAREQAARRSGFIGLPERDRAVIQQAQQEKYPAEFAPLVEQYLLNLATETQKK